MSLIGKLLSMFARFFRIEHEETQGDTATRMLYRPKDSDKR